jgi:hypothetical protein
VTTIAASLIHKEIAADSKCSSDDSFCNVWKLRNWKDGPIGAAGDWGHILKFFEALETNGEVDSEWDIEVLQLQSSGLYIYEASLKPYPIKDKFYAIGSGAAYALAAMALGKSPREAVEIAARFDPGTGGEIDVIKLGRNRAVKSKR